MFFVFVIKCNKFCQILPNKASNPILIGAAVSDLMIKDLSNLLYYWWMCCEVQKLKNIHDLRHWLMLTTESNVKKKISSLTYRNLHQNTSSLLDNFLNIHQFGMWKVTGKLDVWASYSCTKFACWSCIFFENFEVKLAAGASNLGLKLTLPPTVARNDYLLIFWSKCHKKLETRCKLSCKFNYPGSNPFLNFNPCPTKVFFYYISYQGGVTMAPSGNSLLIIIILN